jgi:YD repeat-containing protein
MPACCQSTARYSNRAAALPTHKHQATGAGSNTFSYDVAGNMTSRTIAGQATQNLVWDESSRLETLTQGTTTTGFLYDADGSRVARRDSGVTTVMIDNTFEWSSDRSSCSFPAKSTSRWILGWAGFAFRPSRSVCGRHGATRSRTD